MRARLLCLSLTVLARGALGYLTFESKIPNGDNVYRTGVRWTAVGHDADSYVPAKNLFGLAFKEAGLSWTTELCRADADGDGQSNGLELGDPDCVWQEGATPARTTDVSHPGYADSVTLAAPTSSPNSVASSTPSSGTAAPTTTAIPASSTSAAATGACEASGLEVDGTTFDCMAELGNGVVLHWTVRDNVVDLAAEKPSATGYLAVGFPETPGKMVGAHAAVAQGDADLVLRHLTGYGAADQDAVTAETMRVPIASASAVSKGGKLLVTISGAKLPDVSAFEVVYAIADSAYPAYHTARGGRMLNLLGGAPPATTALTTSSAQLATEDGDTCTRSTLEVDGAPYDCMLALGNGVALHWRPAAAVPSAARTRRRQDAAMDLAVEQPSDKGWVSLGFPDRPGKMMGAHCVAARPGAEFWFLASLAAPTERLTAETLKVPIAGARSVVQGGKMVLAVDGVAFRDPAEADLIYGVAGGAWPAIHSGRGGATVNLLGGGAVVAPELSGALFFVAVAVVLMTPLAGAAYAAAAAGAAPSFLTKPLVLGQSPAAAAAYTSVGAAMLLLILFLAVGGVEEGLTGIALGLGLAAAMAGAATMWLACMRAGLHSLLRISRESAWAVHALLGGAFLTLGTLHGAILLAQYGFATIAEQPGWLLGLPAVVLMWAGVLPAHMYRFKESIFRYDTFKMLHFLAPIGYLLIVFHIVGPLLVVFKARVAVVAVIASLGMISWLLSMLSVRCCGRTRAKVLSAKRLSDKTGQHLALELEAPRFGLKPGQWARLHVPSVGKVGHPFTAFAGPRPDTVCFCIKSEGRWTRALNGAELEGCEVSIEGPYGLPPVLPALAWCDGVIFLLGGVGVTPALSLVPAVFKAGRSNFVFWALRSPALFLHGRQWLEGNVEPGDCHLQLPAGNLPEAGADEQAKLQPASQRRSAAEFLSDACQRMSTAAGRPAAAMVFVCGPPGLAVSAKEGIADVARRQPQAKLQLHVEHFHFVPQLPMCLRPAKSPQTKIATE